MKDLLHNWKISGFIIIMLMLPSLSQRGAVFASPASFPSLGTDSVLSSPLYHPDDSVGSVIDEVFKRRFSPFIRVGFGMFQMMQMYDEDLSDYYDVGWGLMADCMFYRLRTRKGNGLDLYTRFSYRNFRVSDDNLEKYSELRYEKNIAHLFGLDVGVRGIVGFFFLREFWQIYILAAPRILFYRADFKESRYGDEDKAITLLSVGFICGAGLEVTIMPYLGIFAEYNIGYTPVGTGFANVEGHQIFVGFTWRRPGRYP